MFHVTGADTDGLTRQLCCVLQAWPRRGGRVRVARGLHFVLVGEEAHDQVRLTMVQAQAQVEERREGEKMRRREEEKKRRREEEKKRLCMLTC